jgi:hypothetical protein
LSSGSVTRTQILDSLGEAMLARGWSLHSFSGLPEVFAKTELVTAYYGIGDIRPFKDGWYGLGGHVGVLHQEFEEIWAERAGKDGPQPLLTTCLLIANLAALREVAYVQAETLPADVNRFVTILNELLCKMPQSEVELKVAFDKGLLCGQPIDDFSGWSQRPKFAEFRKFVERLP